MSDRTRVTAAVESYWLEAGLSPDEAAEMRSELEQHLTDAAADGMSVDEVVGDTAAFAVNWAEALAATGWPSELRPSPPGKMYKVDRQEKNGCPVEISSHTGSALLP
jgi:hypothetical protein